VRETIDFSPSELISARRFGSSNVGLRYESSLVDGDEKLHEPDHWCIKRNYKLQNYIDDEFEMSDRAESLKDTLPSEIYQSAPARGTSREKFRVLLEPREWLALLRKLYGSSPRHVLRAAHFIYQNFSSFVARCLWASVVLIILMIVYQGLTQHVTVVEAISVPKALADRGYSQDVAAQRFRDVIAKFAKPLKTGMRTSEVALHTELPNIVVPTVGISLDAVMSSIRSLLRSTRSQSIGGELTIDNNLLWLRLRLNGVEFYSSKEGGDPEKPDEVFAVAVPEAMKKIQPYLVALSLSHNQDPDGALDILKWITVNLPQDDENVAWAYNLRGIILKQRKEYVAADEALQMALRVNSRFAPARVNLGNLKREIDRLPEAIAEYREAIRIDSHYSLAHNQLGLVLDSSGKTEEAILEYREAIRVGPKDAIPHNNLGVVLRRKKNDEAAIAEYREATELDPNFSLPHSNFAIILAANRDFAGAIKENKEAIRLDPNNIRAHNNLGNSLAELGRNEEAVSEYREALRLDPKNIATHIRLAKTLDQLGREGDAIIEFQAIVAIAPDNEIAHDFLKAHPGIKDERN
jgi:Flp pilus assembly protein TadD